MEVLSCKKTFLVLHRDKVVLRFRTSFSEGSSAFYLNQNIVPSSPYLALVHCSKNILHHLDVFWAVSIYFLTPASSGRLILFVF